MVNAVDCATKLNTTSATILAKAGITHVGRYLGHSWKGLELSEVKPLKRQGFRFSPSLKRLQQNQLILQLHKGNQMR
jgi:hypothetical protein